MALSAGVRLGPYEILAPLGAGGMGEVYRATDTTLNRDVAIKVLPPEVAHDPERLARFRREAQLLAALNHPNIAAIYGLEEADGQLFLALELIEGEGLEERLARGAVPVDEALRIARQIAEALEEAHEKGIVHRDLKPANVKVTPEGKVKVLDFGLGKAYPAENAASPDFSQSPTLAASGTQAGVILGTAAYMSPEQASGKPVDKRADIWAVGVVLFEMVTGRPLFSGETASELLASVIKDEPDWSLLPKSTSFPLRRLLRWCLTKDPRQRLQHVGDARILLGNALNDRSEREDVVVASGDRSWTLVGLIGLAACLLGAGVTWVVTPEATPPTPVAATAWNARPLTVTGDAWNVALSPDGRTVAYLTSEGLVTHDVDGGSPNLILPDSAWARGRPIEPGKPLGEPQWLHDGSAVAFNLPIDSATLGISAVQRMGGEITPKLVTSFSGGETEASFQSLAGGEFLLARVLENREAAPWIRWLGGEIESGIDPPPDIVDVWDAVASNDGLYAAYVGERTDRTNVVATISRDGKRHNVIAERGTELSKWAELSINRQWASNRIMRWPSGNRLYYRQISPRGVDIFATTIDPSSGQGIGDPELVYSGLPPGASFDVALDAKRLVYSGGVTKTQIRLFRFDADRGGDPIEDWRVTQGTARHVAPRFSPDGRRLAYIRKSGRSEDIYIVEVAGGELRRVNVLYRWLQLVDLKWSPDGNQLAVYALTSSGAKLVLVSLSDSRVRELPTQSPRSTWFDWSPDGTWIAYGSYNDGAYVLHELDTGEEREVFGELQGEKIQGLFSADGTELLMNNIGLAEPGLWASRIDGGTVRLVTEDAGLRTYPMRWSREGVIHLLAPDGAILTVDASGGEPKEFGRIPEAPIWEGWASMSVESGSLYLACAVDEPRESDVWVLDRIEP